MRSLALAKAPFDLPQKLHHLMVETNSRDDVGEAFDRAWAAGLGIPNGLGRAGDTEPDFRLLARTWPGWS